MIGSVRLRCGLRGGTILLVLVLGCRNGSWGRRDELPPEPPPQASPRSSSVLADTIGSYALLSGATGERVRGFSLVVGLGEDGSRDCPTAIRKYLIDYLSLQFAPKDGATQRPPVSPSRLIDSPDTAVVEVAGIVPAGAPRGAQFDVQVRAVAGTATRSLEGGLLLPCELRLFKAAEGREGLIGGRTVAQAHGPVFTNPFTSAAGSGSASEPRRGFVLNGGRTIIERSVRLLLLEPSYSLARRIERRINERFGQRPRAAEAMSKGYLRLHTPPSYAERPERFTQLVTHLYLPSHPAFYERKLRELAQALTASPAEGERIALVWEGIGRVAIPQIQPLYGHAQPLVRFYAAQAGLRLQDAAALPVMTEIALDASQPRRLQAVKELGASALASAGSALTPLLDDQDQEVRIAAYEGLRRHGFSSAIQTRVFASALNRAETSLILDVVASRGPPLVYVRRTRAPRIAVFGTRTPLVLPVFYSHPQERVVLNATAGAGDITLFYRAPQSRKLSEKIMVPSRLVDLVVALADLPVKDDAERLRGVGLSYSQVVQVLAALERDGALPARLVLERQSLTELLGPMEIPERLEADEPPPAEAPPESALDSGDSATSEQP